MLSEVFPLLHFMFLLLLRRNNLGNDSIESCLSHMPVILETFECSIYSVSRIRKGLSNPVKMST
jgi:hypothetical protein